MVKLTLLYGNPKNAAAFEKYYAETHLPIAGPLPGAIATTVPVFATWLDCRVLSRP